VLSRSGMDGAIFRRPIPKALQPFVAQGCRTEFIVSLKTKDRRELGRRYAEALQQSDRLMEEAAASQEAGNGRTLQTPNSSAKQTNRLSLRPLHGFSQQELQVLVHRWYLKAKGDALEANRFIFNMCSREERASELSKLEVLLESLECRSGASPDLETPRQCRELIEGAGGFIDWRHPATFMQTNTWFTSVRERRPHPLDFPICVKDDTEIVI